MGIRNIYKCGLSNQMLSLKFGLADQIFINNGVFITKNGKRNPKRPAFNAE